MQKQVRNSEIIGRQIYILDKVSAIATDVLMEKVPKFRDEKLAGYLPFQEAGDDLRPKGSYVVTFFTKEEDEPTNERWFCFMPVLRVGFGVGR